MKRLEQLRTLAVLLAVYEWEQSEGETPKQTDLYPDEGVSPVSQLWDDRGLRDRYPFGPDNVPQFFKAVQYCREAGLMVEPGVFSGEPRGTQRVKSIPPTGYDLTEKGRALAASLGDDWQAWPEIA